MCIRDSAGTRRPARPSRRTLDRRPDRVPLHRLPLTPRIRCLLYTSDAADERSSVDLGGRRIIKKKKNNARA